MIKRPLTIAAAGIKSVNIRSPLTCQAKQGVVRSATVATWPRGNIIGMNTAVGIIAAQIASVSRRGTQLTLRPPYRRCCRTGYHDRSAQNEELFEARTPKNQAILSEINGVAEVTETDDGQTIKVTSSETFSDERQVPAGWKARRQDTDSRLKSGWCWEPARR